MSDTSFIKGLRDRIAELEKENRELKEKYDGLWKIYTEDVNERVEENKRLEEELSNLQVKYDLVLRLYSKYGTTKGQSD